MLSKFNIPTVIVVFGATGDLAKKKIFPALFNLYRNNLLPKKFSIMGTSRSVRSNEDFRTYLTQIITEFEDGPPPETELKQFLELCTYQQAQFGNMDDYKAIAETLGRKDDYWRICSNKLFYLAVPPNMYKEMLLNLSDSGLTDPCSPEEGWTRVLIEKPLGYDAKTAEEIDTLLGNLFKEEQVYRIDHYLAKEMVQNILTFRFANNLLEESWNNKFIDKIEIRMLENFGVENRGSFYDGLGALRDVGQNHILQMLALTLMDKPASLTQDHIRQKRKEILDRLVIPDKEYVQANTFRGQYEGYRQIKGVAPESTTETYFRVKAQLNHPRWEGVPIYMESGKRVGETKNEVIVTFKEPFPVPPGSENKEFRNIVTFSIEPNEEIEISFISKKPGLQFTLEENDLEFMLREKKPRNKKAEEYERVLTDCIRGDQMLFVTTEEVQSMWRFIDPIIDAWEHNAVPLHLYPPDTQEILKQAEENIQPETMDSTMPQEIGLVGLGKMGGGVALQLVEKGWVVHAYNRTRTVTDEYAAQGVTAAYSLKEMVDALPSPKVIWLMVPAGKPVDEMLFGDEGLVSLLNKGDIIIDGGNSNFNDTKERYQKLKQHGIKFMDVGTSGGPAGARYGACLMIGGDRDVYEYLRPLFCDLAIPNGMQFFDGPGAGHFVKMVHNGIEYGMMQAIGEGFDVMKQSDYNLDLKKVAEIYNHGSVIESRLIGWLLAGFEKYGDTVDKISTTVHHSGEGQWTVETAKKMGVDVPIIEGSLQFRIDSSKKPSYTGKIVNLLRNMFGGHENALTDNPKADTQK